MVESAHSGRRVWMTRELVALSSCRVDVGSVDGITIGHCSPFHHVARWQWRQRQRQRQHWLLLPPPLPIDVAD